jgi:hypothetical protein
MNDDARNHEREERIKFDFKGHLSYDKETTHQIIAAENR